MIRDSLDQSDKERKKMEQRLSILEKMVNQHLETAKEVMLNGDRNDQQIHTGKVVELTKQVYVSYYKGGAEDTSKTSDDDKKSLSDDAKDTSKTSADHKGSALSDGIREFFDGQYRGGFIKIVEAAVSTVLGNATMGEHEGTSMFIVWNNDALLRLDAYYYRWNFYSREVIQNVEGVQGVIVMKRVIDLTKVDPQVLTWAISSQTANENEANALMDEAIRTITRVSKLQKAVKSIEVDEHSQGIGGKDD